MLAADRPRADASTGAVIAVANTVAGTASKLDLDALEDRMRSVLGARFAGFHRAAGEDMDATLKAALSERPGAVVVVGGDGTARAAAKAAMAAEDDVAVVPLPAGTMNILPRLVFGHADLDRAVGALDDLRPAWLPAGMVGGEPFFLSAAFGFSASLARLREAMRPPRDWRAVASAAGACARASLHSVRGGPLWRVGEARWRRAHTLIIAVGSVARVVHPDESAPEAGSFEVAALRLRSAMDALRLGGVALTSNWRESRHVEITRAGDVQVRMKSARPVVVLDGEPVRVSRIDHVTLKRRAVPILAPPA